MSRTTTLHAPDPTRTPRRDGRAPRGPDPADLAGLVARVFLEVETGRRPLSQLEPLMAPPLYDRLRGTWPRRRCPVSCEVLGVTVSRTQPDACDAAVVVRRGARAGSLALRLERRGGVWRVVELARPEDHGTTYRPPPLIVRR